MDRPAQEAFLPPDNSLNRIGPASSSKVINTPNNCSKSWARVIVDGVGAVIEDESAQETLRELFTRCALPLRPAMPSRLKNFPFCSRQTLCSNFPRKNLFRKPGENGRR